MVSLGLRSLALGGVAWASLQLALLGAQLRFLARAGHPTSGGLARGIVLLVIVGVGVWLYGRSEPLAARLQRSARHRGAI